MNAIQLTIAQIANNYYLPAKRQRRQPNTLYGYESSINLHVLPRFGSLCISDITRDDVQAWVDELATTSAGIGGTEKAYKCLRQIIRWAIDKWSIYVADPTRGIELPRKKEHQPETLTNRRLKRLIRGAVGCQFEATLILSAALGLRFGECLFLHWQHINWRTGMVQVRGTLQQIAGRVYEAPTKTAKSERECYLPPWALDRLHTLWCEAGRPRGRIVADAKPSKVRRVIQQWIAVHKLPRISMKNLRHTWATLAIQAGVQIEHVAAMLGHTNIQTCYRYYMALNAAVKRRAQRKLSRLVLGKCDDMYRGVLPDNPLRIAA